MSKVLKVCTTTSTSVVSRIGSIIGSVTRHSACAPEAPSTRAASYTSSGMVFSPA